MKKLKLIPGLILLALCLAVLGVGIYAAAPASNTITGTVSVTAANAEVSIALYDTPTDYNPASAFGTGTTKKGNTRTGLSLSYSAVEFNASSANVASDVAPATKLIVVKNNSTTKHLGVYFQDKAGSYTIHSSYDAPTQATMSINGSNEVTASDILYGNITTHYNASALNNKVQLNCSFYSHLAPSATVEMLVQFSLLDLDYSTAEPVTLNLYLNVEEYNASASTTAGFVKWNPASIPTGVVDDNSVIGPESVDNAELVNPNNGGGGSDPYSSYRSGLVALVIPNGPISLGAVNDGEHFGFMRQCQKLVALSIPNSVTSIERDAFVQCYALTSIIIPRSVSSIYSGEWTFVDCTNLTTIIVDPNNATYDSRGGCNAIITKDIVGGIPANTLIYGCNGTTVVPNSVTSLYQRAFYSRTALTSITLSNTLTTIGVRAFENCAGLSSITIPSSVNSINETAFYVYSATLTSVIFENPNGWSYSSNSNMSSPTALSSSDLANPSTAATYLTSTYINKYWART